MNYQLFPIRIAYNAFRYDSSRFSTTSVNHPARSSLEVKGMTALILTVAAAELFKCANFLSYSGVRPVTEHH